MVRLSSLVSVVVALIMLVVTMYIFTTVQDGIKSEIEKTNDSVANKTMNDVFASSKPLFDILPVLMIITVIGFVLYMVVGFARPGYEEDFESTTTSPSPRIERDIIPSNSLPGHFVSTKEDFVAVYQGSKQEAIKEIKKLRRGNYFTKTINTDKESTNGTWIVYRSKWKRTDENNRGIPRWNRRRHN